MKCGAKKYEKYLLKLPLTIYITGGGWYCKNEKMCALRKKGTNYKK